MDYRECKIKYLININCWLVNQCLFISDLTKTHKNVLHENKATITPMLDIRRKLQNQLKNHTQQLQYFTIYESKNHQKSRDSIEFYRKLKEAYEHRMVQLNSRIFVRQTELQKYQQKIKRMNNWQLRQVQDKKQIEQLVQSVQIYPRLITSYKCENMKLSYVLSLVKSPILSSQSQRLGLDLDQRQNLSELFDRRLPIKQQGQPKNKIKIDSTILEEIIFCYKKKQYISRKRKQQIKALREKISLKNRQIELLRNSINQLDQFKIGPQDADSFSMNISEIGKRVFPKLVEDACVQNRQNLFPQQVWEDIPTFLLDQ